jgi:hypothetical protein
MAAEKANFLDQVLASLVCKATESSPSSCKDANGEHCPRRGFRSSGTTEVCVFTLRSFCHHRRDFFELNRRQFAKP